MKYYDYSDSQLENEADKLNFEFDKERLYKPKGIDVYDVVDFLGCTPDFLYLTPDQSVLGMTAYCDIPYLVWYPLNEIEEKFYAECVFNGLHPKKALIKKDTIVIDRSLSESNDRGRENFTCIHECFHKRLHTNCFKYRGGDYGHFSTKQHSSYVAGLRSNMTAIEKIERQANYCAAAFLMPLMAVRFLLMEILGLKNLPKKPIRHTDNFDAVIREMAKKFSVNYSPMKYRLQDLNLLDSSHLVDF